MKGDIIAIDLGGTHLRTALVRNNKVIKYLRKNTPKEKNSLVREMCESISQFMNDDIVGIGAGRGVEAQQLAGSARYQLEGPVLTE